MQENPITTPWWWQHAPPCDDAPTVLPERCDVAVVGGGFAGLCAALELARGGALVVVLDAGPLGGGASTRNSGALSVRFDLARASRALRDEPALLALAQSATQSLDFVQALVAREAIACDLAITGSFLGAWTRAHHATLARRAGAMRRYFGVQASVIGRGSQHAHVGSERFHGGMLTEGTGQLHPARYHAGLVAACRRAGALLAPRTAVSAIAGDDKDRQLQTARGPLRAREVLVATNGYTGAVTPALQRRVIPVGSHIIVTEPLADELARVLLPDGRVVSDTRRLLSYFRLTPAMPGAERSLLFGARAGAADGTPDVAALRARMLDVFPQLAGTRITHAWGGQVGFTFDWLPHMGREGGLAYALGCNANGVAIMSHLGHQSARRLLGDPGPTSAFDGRPFPSRAWYRGRAWFVPLASGWYRLMDRLEALAG